MLYSTKLRLAVVHQHCKTENKSTEYMFQLMQDTCKVDIDTCINYMFLSDNTHKDLFTQVNAVAETIINLNIQ